MFKFVMNVKVFYYENNGYNGILITRGDGKWISYDEVIDGIEITRENIGRIAEIFKRNYYDSNDFQTAYDQAIGTLIYGKNAEYVLEEQDYYEEIYNSYE